MKRFTALITAIIIILISVTCCAKEEFSVFINSMQIPYDESTGLPFADESGRIMVPLRQTMEAFGATVTWNPEPRTVTIRKDKKILILTLGSNVIKTSDRIDIVSDTPPYARDGRIYLPVRVVAEQLALDVVWNGQLETVYAVGDDYQSFKNMFSYSESLKENSNVNTVVISANYCGELSTDEFKEYWIKLDEDKLKTYLHIIASEKKNEHPEKEILINFFSKPPTDNEINQYLGSVSTFSYDAKKYNPFK